MMRKVSLAQIILCILSLGVSNSFAADKENLFAIKGVGTASCARFIESSKQRDEEFLLYVGHITGYITAYNQLTNNVFDVTAWETPSMLLTHVSRFCQTFPDQTYQIALNEMIRFLQASAIDARSDLVEFKKGEHATQLYLTTAVRMREKLITLGVMKNDESAVTSDVVERFQKANELPPTGVPDQSTLAKLFYSVAGE